MRTVLRRVLLVCAAACVLVAACPASYAQSIGPALPDAGVRGSGSIPVVYPDQNVRNVGVFDINVWRTGTALFGGFKFAEYASSASRPVNVIYSSRILGLDVRGNFATVKAEGYWNGVLCDLLVEALDDLNDDWFHIHATPRYWMPPIREYDAAGGVDGQIVVWSAPPPPDGYAKGYGTIPIDATNRLGKFQFWATRVAGVLKGNLYYAEVYPTTSPTVRPPVRIYVPTWQTMTIDGITVELSGKGLFNGRPALVRIKGVDWSRSMLPVVRPDEFYIWANATSSSITDFRYYAGGPVTGDITVGYWATTP